MNIIIDPTTMHPHLKYVIPNSVYFTLEQSEFINIWNGGETKENIVSDKIIVNDNEKVQIRPEKEGYLSYKDRKNQNSFDLDKNTLEVYDYGNTSLISNNSKVYKGGSWDDRAYWMVPGTRRHLDQSLSTATIGFRCAMDRLGPPTSQLKENQRKPVDWERKKGY